jgi:DNA repair exonuclease SbcCD nuclease subunit
MKQLVIGDVHVVPSELPDCSNLIDFIVGVSEEAKVDQVLFSGDIHHFHNTIRAEVLHFWDEAFARLKNVTCLTGNHDLGAESGDPKVHALIAHKRQIHVIDQPWTDSGILYMPYRSDKELFIKECKEARPNTNTIIGHQSFNGAQFDNGFFDPSGIDLDFIQQRHLIMGHIHKPQKFSKVEYLGAPRWRSLSDANTDRNIVLYDFDDKGNILNRTNFSTNEVCRQIKFFNDTEEAPFDLNTFNPKHDYRIDVKGTESYIEKRKKELQMPGLKIRTFKTDQTKIHVRESDGIKTAYHKFVSNYKPKFGTPQDKLIDLSNERLGFNNAN